MALRSIEIYSEREPENYIPHTLTKMSDFINAVKESKAKAADLNYEATNLFEGQEDAFHGITPAAYNIVQE